MSSSKRSRVGHRELHELLGNRDEVPAKCTPAKRTLAKEDVDAAPGLSGKESGLPADKTAMNMSPNFSGGTCVADVAMTLSPIAGEKRVQNDAEAEEEETTRKRYKSANTGSFRDHVRLTRSQAARQRANYLRVDFNYRFRGLPIEVKEMIFSLVIQLNCKKTPDIVVGLRSRLNYADEELYQAAWAAFCNKNTFVLSRQNSYTANQSLVGAMPPTVWKTVRSLKITHEYMKRGFDGTLRLFMHDPSPFGSCRYTPCVQCDFGVLTMACQLRSLHLDFGDAHHCIMPMIQRTCRLAIETMALVRLDVTVSNIWAWHSSRYLSDFICKISDATQETGLLISVGSKAHSTGSWSTAFASETWFWCTTGKRSHLTWTDDWPNKRAHDDARMAVLYGVRKPVLSRKKPVVVEGDAEMPDTEGDPDATDDDPDLEPERARNDWSSISSPSYYSGDFSSDSDS